MTMFMIVFTLEEWSIFIEFEYIRSNGDIIPNLMSFINVVSSFRGALARYLFIIKLYI